jgi:hypothetical protein
MITVGVSRPTPSAPRAAEQLGDSVDQQRLDGERLGRASLLDAPLQVGKQELGRLDAGIGHQQRGLELLVERIVDLRAGKDLGNARAGLAQPAAQLVEPALAMRRFDHSGGLDGGRGRGLDGGRGRGLGDRRWRNRGLGRRLLLEETEHLGRVAAWLGNSRNRAMRPGRVAIISGSGALAQSVRATES